VIYPEPFLEPELGRVAWRGRSIFLERTSSVCAGGKKCNLEMVYIYVGGFNVSKEKLSGRLVMTTSIITTSIDFSTSDISE
jgi:hypothetical protein